MLMIAGISIQDKGLTNGSRAKAVGQALSQTYGQSASVRWWRGLATVAKSRTNRRKNPARPRKQENCSSLELVGVGQSGADAALARLVVTPCSFSMCPRNNVSLVSREHLEGFSHKPAQWIAGRTSIVASAADFEELQDQLHCAAKAHGHSWRSQGKERRQTQGHGECRDRAARAPQRVSRSRLMMSVSRMSASQNSCITSWSHTLKTSRFLPLIPVSCSVTVVRRTLVADHPPPEGASMMPGKMPGRTREMVDPVSTTA
ncbi:unnamed protein product [Arctogadus glacialis]